MALRLIEVVLGENEGAQIQELLQDQTLLELRQVRLDGGEVLVRILLEAEQSEAVIDLLEERLAESRGARIVVLPVVATLPRPESEDAARQQNHEHAAMPQRVSREELYDSITNAARCSRVYMAMVVLSSIVATVGLHHDSLAIIIGAMVIAPMLGPNMALALGTTLGDLAMIRRALLTGLVGILTALVLSAGIGAMVHVDPNLTEVATRTNVRGGDMVLALAAGSAGALAFTTGVSATLIGVMVAVALLPPLVTFGLMIGGGHPAPAWGAFSLFLLNFVCVNLAGVITFLLQGIHPATWWEADRAKKATRIAIALWASLLTALAIMFALSRKL